MAYDGRALFLAREAIHKKKQNNEIMQRQRRLDAFSLEPELEALALEMARLMTELALSALKRGEDAGAAVAQAREKSGEIIRRRTLLLKKHNLPEDYLDEIYSCAKCGDTGYVEGKICSCLEAAYRAEASKQLTSMLNMGDCDFSKFDLDLYRPVDDTMSTRKVREAMAGILNICRNYTAHFDEHTDNLLFRGGTGLGKTFMSACIAKVVVDMGFSVVYDTCVSVMDVFETQKFDRNGESDEDIPSRIKRYMNCDLLILDDLGTEMTTAFTQSALYTLINTRLMNGKKTIISTNLSDEELSRRYSPQIVSRLKGEYEVLQFKGRDIREVKKM